ncbi:MAG TPA: heavy metal translocating P-type ATPase [Polyangiaceae bacterium]|nr:heavy metal translocating P-type ATPase [Polyangiaceae bacterium]
MSNAFDLRPATPAATEPVPCAHCGLPVPQALVSSSERSFCCAGCRSVFEIVRAAGLGAYYQYRDPEQAAPARGATPRKYQELDEDSFQSRHCQSGPNGEKSVELLLEGVHCSACVWLVERVGRVVPGVSSARLDMSRNVVSVTWNPQQTQLSRIARGLESLGYPAHPLGESQLVTGRARDRALLLRLGIAGAAAGNVMLMAFALYSGAFSGMEPMYRALFRWTSLAIATPTVFWAGSVFLRGGWAALRTRTPHMDLPVSVGILAGYAGGAINTLTGGGEIYFDSLCTLIFLLLVGRYLQASHHRRSTTQSDLVAALAPRSAHLVEGDAERDVPADAVLTNAIVRVAAGERIPVDGLVLRGSASVDTSLLTGEPMPAETQVSDRVYAGTTCQSGELWLRTEAAGDATRLGRLLTSVAVTQRQRAPIVRLADRVAGYFVVAILIIAAITLGLWLHLDPSHAIDHTVALLVVTCPCALGMATPLAVSAALGRAAKAGILFKGGEFMEELAKPGTIVFDKTGTLTLGQPELVTWLGDAAWQAPVRALERHSSHPLARSLQRAFPDNDLLVENVQELPQGGISGLVAGSRLLVGAPAVVEKQLGQLPGWAQKLVLNHAAAGRTPVLVVADGVVRAALAFGDKLRPEAKQNLSELTALGYDFEILSGDHQSVVDSIARELGIAQAAARGGQSPEAKLERIQSLRRAGRRVIMVGDGVNDAGAMAAANVGLAVHGGAEACLRSADVFATRAGLGPVADAARGSRRTLAAIRRGVGISLAYNVLSVGLAGLGLLSPLFAAILMPLSSISVVSLALRAKTFEKAAT